MKTQNIFSIINTFLLSAILVFIILIYNNSKDCCKNKNESNLINSIESIEKTFNEKIDSLENEFNLLKSRVDSLEIEKKGNIEKLKSQRDALNKIFQIAFETKKETASEDTIKKENIQPEKEAVEKEDSSQIVVEEYSLEDTLTYLDLSGNFDSMFYYHPYKDYSLLNNQIDLTKKQIIQNSVESLLGIGLFVGGLFIPDIKTKVISEVNLDIGGNIVTTSVESIKYRTSPWKIGLIAAGTALALDGIRRNISTIKILNSAQLEIETYPLGLGIKAKF